MSWFPVPNDIHAASSLTGKYEFGHYGTYVNEGLGDKCENGDGVPSTHTTTQWLNPSRHAGGSSVPNSLGLTHTSALSSDEYYVIGNSMEYPYTTTREDHPYVGTEKIFQVIFNRSYANTQPVGQRCETGCFILNELISRPSAAIWWKTPLDSQTDVNYHTMPTPTISPNAEWLHFQGTNGKYTRNDKELCGDYYYTGSCTYIVDNWEGTGTYIAALASAGSDTTPPAAPSGVSVQ